MKRLLLFAALLCSTFGAAQMLNVDQFPGSSVGAKATAAQTQCGTNPCVLIFKPELSAWTAGTLPTRCANCVWLDYRTSGAMFVNSVRVSSLGQDLSYYGAKTDGSDSTPALNAAVTAIESISAFERLRVPCGRYSFTTKPANIGYGLQISGCKLPGSNDLQGTVFLVNYTESTATNGFLTWDGHSILGACAGCSGTGAGIDNVLIEKQDGKTGGAAIKFTGSDDDHRAGWTAVQNVIITSTGTGSWNTGIYYDGSCCTTSGTPGIRDNVIDNAWVFNVADAYKGIWAHQAAHVFITKSSIGAGSNGSANTGILLDGTGLNTLATQDVQIAATRIFGDIKIDQANDVSIMGGQVGNFISTANTTNNCSFYGVVATSITNPNNVCRIVQASGNASVPPSQIAGAVDYFEQAAPANPAAGWERVWPDSTAHTLKCITSTGASCAASGGGGTPGGSPGTLQWNSAGAFAGVSGSSVDATTGNIVLGPTWNSGGTTETALKDYVTDTASAAGSLLFDFGVGVTSKFSADKSGNVVAAGNLNVAGSLTFGSTGTFTIPSNAGGGTTADGNTAYDTTDKNTTLGGNGAKGVIPRTLSTSIASSDTITCADSSQHPFATSKTISAGTLFTNKVRGFRAYFLVNTGTAAPGLQIRGRVSTTNGSLSGTLVYDSSSVTATSNIANNTTRVEGEIRGNGAVGATESIIPTFTAPAALPAGVSRNTVTPIGITIDTTADQFFYFTLTCTAAGTGTTSVQLLTIDDLQVR
jgi:hypothetical protein